MPLIFWMYNHIYIYYNVCIAIPAIIQTVTRSGIKGGTKFDLHTDPRVETLWITFDPFTETT